MNEFDVEARTREVYRLIAEDFLAIVRDWLTDDFVWINHVAEHIPFGGVYEGSEGLQRYVMELASSIELKPLHIDEILVKDLTAVVIGTERGTRVIPTGKFYDMDYVHVLRFAPDGRLEYFREYNQYEGMAAAFLPD